MKKVDNIEKGIYEGYIWYSDQKEPEVIMNEEYQCSLDKKDNPFIVEAQLYDKANKNSYSIKYVDGEYFAVKYENVSEEMEVTATSIIQKQVYYANRMGNKQLLFLQKWEEREDPLCENMKVLQPAEWIFVGFKKDKEERQ